MFDDLELEELRSRSGAKWRYHDDDVWAAWVADMDFRIAEPIRRALGRLVEGSDLGYPMHPTRPGLADVFCAYAARRYDWSVEPRLVEVTTDVVQSLFVGLEVFSEPGDDVLIQTPIYPPFLGAVAETKREAVVSTLVAGPARYEIDFDALERRAGDGVRIFMLCNPHNPTGRVFDRAELVRLAELAIERDWIVLSDEIHADLVYPGARHVPIASLGPEIAERTVTLMSASKAYNVAGLRCAVAVFGSRERKRRFNAIPRHLRGGINAMGLEATRAAWEECEEWLDAAVAYLAGNRDFVGEFVAREFEGVGYRAPEGTYMAWLDFRERGLAPSPQEFFLKEARVALSDGRTFGDGGDGFVRLNFATSRALLVGLLERMAESLAGR